MPRGQQDAHGLPMTHGSAKAELAELIAALPGSLIETMGDILLTALLEGHSTYTLGNGGSAALAAHLALDLTMLPQPVTDSLSTSPMVRCLSADAVVLTALANDFGFEHVFEKQLAPSALAGDVVIAISTSGRSPNVLTALEVARSRRATCLGLTGLAGSPLETLCHHTYAVGTERPTVAETLHAVFCQLLITHIRAALASCTRPREDSSP
jgi:D-sedoheptulose 7-phosphate isomerase